VIKVNVVQSFEGKDLFGGCAKGDCAKGDCAKGDCCSKESNPASCVLLSFDLTSEVMSLVGLSKNLK